MTKQIVSLKRPKSASDKGSILLREYVSEIAKTDKLPPHDLRPVLLGLFGEVGSILATAKKVDREGKAYIGFHDTVAEEFGDTLWYFAALCRRLKIELESVFSAVSKGPGYGESIAASDLLEGSVSHVASFVASPSLHDAFLKLGDAVSPLLDLRGPGESVRGHLSVFADHYLQALRAAGVTFSSVVHENIAKTRGRFLHPDFSRLPTFDHKFLEEERIPQNFAIKITQRKSGQSYLQWNGVFVGDPLTDNILDRDGYRFHDVFHFAHAAILHWSPVFRALIKQKRKSDREYDEAQDGGRAIVVEEGLTAWIFSRAKALNYFEDQKSISFDLLKTIGQFVKGYEVDQCPLMLWERAILQGFAVFRKVRDNNGGIVIGDRKARTIGYRSLKRGRRT
ncbi:MAG: nucleoside triphosphate pyrophosphohydrolase family protein [Rhizomicrobium sp.]